MWIRIPKAPEYGSNTDPDPQHWSQLVCEASVAEPTFLSLSGNNDAPLPPTFLSLSGNNDAPLPPTVLDVMNFFSRFKGAVSREKASVYHMM